MGADNQHETGKEDAGRTVVTEFEEFRDGVNLSAHIVGLAMTAKLQMRMSRVVNESDKEMVSCSETAAKRNREDEVRL
jgi:hypothetical protein